MKIVQKVIVIFFSLTIIGKINAQYLKQRSVIYAKDAVSFENNENKTYPLVMLRYFKDDKTFGSNAVLQKKLDLSLISNVIFKVETFRLTRKTDDIIALAQAKAAFINEHIKFHYVVIKSYHEKPSRYVVYFLQKEFPT